MTEKLDTLPKIKNAGEILLGDYTPVTLCNFVLGPNAILPTGGFAKTLFISKRSRLLKAFISRLCVKRRF